MQKSTMNAIRRKISARGKGWVFTPQDFADLGSDTGVRTALSRLQKEQFIRRVSHGIYDYPRMHPALGTLSPPLDEVAKAYAKKNGAKIQAAGAYAANLIGLSEQVSGRTVFLTDGPTGRIRMGKLEILFRKTTVKNMHAAGTRESLVIQAFKFMQRKHISEVMLRKVKNFLKGAKREELNKNIKFAPQWIRTILIDLMDGPG